LAGAAGCTIGPGVKDDARSQSGLRPTSSRQKERVAKQALLLLAGTSAVNVAVRAAACISPPAGVHCCRLLRLGAVRRGAHRRR